MNKSKRLVNHFINHLFGTYHLAPRIPVHVLWKSDSLAVGNSYAFGFFHYDENGDETPCIYVAARKIGTTNVLLVIAHEFVHYLQYLSERNMDENEQIEFDADKWAAGLYGQWLINKKKTNEHCYGCAPVWEKFEKEAKE